MIEAGRWQAIIELLSQLAEGGPADGVAAHYFRARRYIGAKDRAFIADRYYTILREQARLNWWIAHVLGRTTIATPRQRVITHLALIEGWSRAVLIAAFDGETHRPAKLASDERILAEKLSGQPLEHAAQPEWVRLEYPEWLEAELKAVLGGDAEERAILREPAALDLRVNTLKTDRAAMLDALREGGITAAPTPLSPHGIRVKGRPQLGANALLQDGLIEIQDEGAQLVALLCHATPGEAVIDYCAGAGGKTLALAATMQNKGRLVAVDNSALRLDRAVKRLRRAGVHNVERRVLGSDNAHWLKRQAGRFDCVLADVPCSGTGTWRRNPDMKWRLTETDVEELIALQREILATAARLVKPGGRLIYATCSLLRSENEDQVKRFLVTNDEFSATPVGPIWRTVIGHDMPPDKFPPDAIMLRLTPYRHGTDGFFAAFLQRAKPVSPPA